MDEQQSGWGGPRPNSGPKRKYISVKLPLPDYADVIEAARLSGFDTEQDYIRSEIFRDARDTIARETGAPLCSVCEMCAGEIECAVCKKWFCGFHYAKTHDDDEEPFERKKGMTIHEALSASDVDCAEYVNANNIAYNVDGSGDGWFVTSGVSGMPVSETQHFESRSQAIAALPDGIRDARGWESIESE